jgi:AcrR family transcriptional regulator
LRLTAQVQKYAIKTSRATQAKRKIMNTAADLFAERGYGKGALYYHIRSKEDLLVSIITDHMDELIASGGEVVEAHSGTQARVHALTGCFVDLMLENPAAMTVCFRDIHAIIETGNKSAVMRFHDTYRGFWTNTFAEGAAVDEHRCISEVETLALLGMYFCAVTWVNHEGSYTRDEIVQTLSRTVLDTVMSRTD